MPNQDNDAQKKEGSGGEKEGETAKVLSGDFDAKENTGNELSQQV